MKVAIIGTGRMAPVEVRQVFTIDKGKIVLLEIHS